MNKPKTAAELQAAKRQISLKAREFENRLSKAKNDFYIVQILDEMRTLIDAEIFSWVNIIDQSSDDSEDDQEKLLSEASEHVASLNSFIDTIMKFRSSSISNALMIQQAMLNCHELQVPIIQE